MEVERRGIGSRDGTAFGPIAPVGGAPEVESHCPATSDPPLTPSPIAKPHLKVHTTPRSDGQRRPWWGIRRRNARGGAWHLHSESNRGARAVGASRVEVGLTVELRDGAFEVESCLWGALAVLV